MNDSQLVQASGKPAPDPTRRGPNREWLTRLATWLSQPNPIWLREMKQSSRLTRTPFILATVTVLMTLLICAVGGAGATSWEMAEVGSVLFQTFFSLAFAVVSWVGPGVGAMTISTERSGRTWEALLLTTLPVRSIAHGKFAAAYTYVSLYVVMLAPVGGLSFMFGGVTALEVVLAFALLFAFIAVAIGFGLAVSSAVSNPVIAMLITVPVAVVVSISAYLGLGVGLSVAAHQLWPSIAEGAPVWLPAALARAPGDKLYFFCLVLAPLALLTTVTWFFYEVTAANITQSNDDRTTGLRRWFLLTAPLVTGLTLLPLLVIDDRTDHALAFIIALVGVFFHGLFAVILFASDAPFRSARVEHRFAHQRATPLRRLLGPGIQRSAVMIIAFGVLFLGGIALAGVFQEQRNSTIVGYLDDNKIEALLLTAGFALSYLVCSAGLLVWLRARAHDATKPRLLLLGFWFVTTAGPWIVMAIAGVLSTPGGVLWIASPSPLFVVPTLEHLLRSPAAADASTIAGPWLMCGAGYLSLGLTLLFLGSKRIRQRRAVTPNSPTEEGNPAHRVAQS